MVPLEGRFQLFLNIRVNIQQRVGSVVYDTPPIGDSTVYLMKPGEVIGCKKQSFKNLVLSITF